MLTDATTPVGIVGLGVLSAFGRGTESLLTRGFAGEPAFAPVTRFDAGRYRVAVAAELPTAGPLLRELVAVVDEACEQAGLSTGQRAAAPLLLAAHADRSFGTAAAMATRLAERCGLAGALRAYTTACVAASTAVADAAVMLTRDGAQRVIVAAGYLVDEDYFGLFDAGTALATDGRIRPFSSGRRGLLLGDGVVAVVLEADPGHKDVLGWLRGWGRAADAHHVCRPHPDGVGAARAISAALRRSGLGPDDIGYVNAHGTGTQYNDPAEVNALRRALGAAAATVPVSSTKSVHGHTLEASALLELAMTLLALNTGTLPVNGGYLGPDPACPLALVLDDTRGVELRNALSVNAAFGGVNTALVLSRGPGS